MSKKNSIIIILIATITLITRFVSLEKNPPSLSNDEISIAYDTYSVAHTLRDEHNHFLPISFQSHNTYKAPLTTYISIPFNLVFGNSTYTARLPSALLGSLTVLLVGLLAYELTTNAPTAFFTAGILALAPAHIYSSRMIQETNIALFFVVLGLLLLYKSQKNHSLAFYMLGFISLALSIYGYHTEWGFTPLLIIIFFASYYKTIDKKAFAKTFLLFIVLVTPIFIYFLSSLHSGSRASTEYLFKDPIVASIFENTRSTIFDKFSIFTSKFIYNYSNYLNLGVLFFYGMSFFERIDPFQIGYFLFPVLPLFITGLATLKQTYKKHAKFIYLLLAISPIIPALTIGDVNNYRFLIIVLPISLITAAGLEYFLKVINKHASIKIWYIFISIIAILYYSIIFFKIFPVTNAQNFQYGYQQIANSIQSIAYKYDLIVVDPRFGAGHFSGVPHLYLPYYLKLDPRYLLARTETGRGTNFWKFEIHDIDWSSQSITPKTLYIVPEFNTPSSPKLFLVDTIYLPDKSPAFRIYSTI